MNRVMLYRQNHVRDRIVSPNRDISAIKQRVIDRRFV